MSADAKIWLDDEGGWNGLHDGPCKSFLAHEGNGDSFSLGRVIRDIERCNGGPLRWEFRTYPDDKIGLVGYED